MAVNYSKCSLNLRTFFILRPSKIYPNWNFCFENKPSGNPAHNQQKRILSSVCLPAQKHRFIFLGRIRTHRLFSEPILFPAFYSDQKLFLQLHLFSMVCSLERFEPTSFKLRPFTMTKVYNPLGIM
jgi:hypothetical protein